MIEFKLPSLGADMDQGKLLEWRVKPGDRVRKGDIVAVVDTSKSAIDVESWHEGTVGALITQPEETIPVGAVMALLLTPGDTAEQVESWKREHASPATATPAAAQPSTAPIATATASVTRARVSPAARKYAAELGVDLSAVSGSGPDGAVTVEDVENASKATKATPAPPDRMGEMRKTIGAAMARSKRDIPHYYLASDIPLASAAAWLTARNARRSVSERVLMAALLLKAVAVSLKRHPRLNGFFRDGQFQPADAVHPGVAISLRQGGLIAPALHHCDSIPLDELMRGLADLVKRTRAFTLKSSELSDPTVTVTNLGDGGADLVHGVIYPPQVAIIGFGGVRERPWVQAGALHVLTAVTATLAADHRVTDGHLGALFLADLSRVLQTPEQLET
jgi:pyruvate dehydrogenase E2 component (dihydrolipoamide acetyltransferase)